MHVNELVGCSESPCTDVEPGGYVVPDAAVTPDAVRIVLISEAAPEDPADYYYAPGDPLYQRTTVQAFQDAGADVSSIADILGLGVYLTTAVKCGKTGYGIQTGTVKACASILEQELALFPDVKALLLMGDVAIQAVNTIAKRTGQPRVIPAGSTYKIRGQPYYWGKARAFPSYLQAGPSYFIEKSKRRMIAEDIAAALAVAR